MELPSVLALNMMDVAEGRGIQIDQALLAERLQLPVVATVGRKGQGREVLREAVRAEAARQAEAPIPPPVLIDYGPLERMIAQVQHRLAAFKAIADLPQRWLALELLEGDSQAVSILAERLGEAAATPLREATVLVTSPVVQTWNRWSMS